MPGRPGEGGVFFLEKASLDSATKRRMLFVLFIFLAVCFVALTVRLFYVQIMQHELYQAKAIDQQGRDTTVTPKRGTIYDRNMKTLAVSASAETVYIAPKSIKDDEEAALIARELSRILGVSEESILKKTQADNYYEVIKRQVEKETADQVREFKTRERITALAPYEGMTPEKVMRGLLGGNVEKPQDE